MYLQYFGCNPTLNREEFSDGVIRCRFKDLSLAGALCPVFINRCEIFYGVIFQQKLIGDFHIIFCSKSLPLQVTAKSSIVTPYGCISNFRWCNLEGKGF